MNHLLPGKERRIYHTFARAALWIVCLYIGYCLLLFVFQRHLLFPRSLIESVGPKPNGRSGITIVWVETPAGRIETWHLPPTAAPPGKPCPLVIFAHGNAELIDDWAAALSPLGRREIGLLLVEYPGYGRSRGRPSQQSITQALIAAYDRFIDHPQVDPERIILMGRSIGGGAVCQLAARRPSAALILMSTFTSARAFASKYLVPKFLVKDPFDNRAVLQTYKKPVLIIHGRHDEIIPFSHGRRLHQTARQSQLLAYRCGHNDCPPRWDIFWKDIDRFLHAWHLVQGP